MATTIRPGDVTTARITKIDDRGLVLTADHATVLVRRDELSLDRHVNASAIHHVGDEPRVFIKKWVPSATAFAGSIRRILPGWQEAMAELRRRQVVSATVEQVWASKVRVDLGPVSGRVLREELSLERGLAPSEIVAVGDEIEIVITKWFEDGPWVVGSRRRALPGWPDAIAQLSVGRVYPASVEYTSAESARVDLGPISAEVSRTELQEDQEADPRAVLGSGQGVRVLLTHRSPDLQTTGHRASVAGAVARWLEETAAISVGEMMQGAVTAIRDDGIEVDLGGGVSGDVPKHELAWEDVEHPQDLFSVGDQVDVAVLWKSPETQKLGLSIRDLDEIGWAIVTGETKTTEFKQVFRGAGGDDVQEEKALQEIVALLNTDGGIVLFGIKDDGTLIGVDAVRRERFESEDNMLVHIDNLLHERLISQGSAVNLVRSRFVTHKGWRLFVVSVEVSDSPVWLRDGGPNSAEEHFYVRREASVKKLTGREEYAHIQARFETQ